jgi:hypothetical protein
MSFDSTDQPVVADSAIEGLDIHELYAERVTVSLNGDGDTVEVWEYFAENIDDFAVAKVIVDHFEARPNDFRLDPERDLFGLFMRAKLTLKRRAIAYVTAQAALQRAAEQVATQPPNLKQKVFATGRFFAAAWNALRSQPQTQAIVVLGVIWYLMR